MALSNSFAAANYTNADVTRLMAELDADPANIDKIYKFGMPLYGQVPFPDKMFREAQREMLYRYIEVHIPQAEAGAFVAVETDSRDVAAAQDRARAMRDAKDRFVEQSEQNVSLMAKLAHDAQKAEREKAERQAMLTQQAAEAERQHVAQMVADKNRIVAVTVQTGRLNQPVTAPKVAKFKQRVV